MTDYESARELGARIQRSTRDWHTTEAFKGENNPLIANLVSAAAWSVGTEEIVHTEIAFHQIGATVTARVVLLSDESVFVVDSDPDPSVMPSSVAVARSSLTYIGMHSTTSLLGGGFGFEDPRETRVELHYAGLENPVVLGNSGQSPNNYDEMLDLYPELVKDLSK